MIDVSNVGSAAFGCGPRWICMLRETTVLRCFRISAQPMTPVNREATLPRECYWVVGPPKVGFAKAEQVAPGIQSGEVGPQPQDDIVIFEGC